MSAATARQAGPTISVDTRVYVARRARAELARRSLFEFIKQAWHVLEPGVAFESNWHIEAFCLHVQAMLEGWLVANGHGTKAMLARVRASWETHGLDYQPGELLVQNLVLNLPPITLKSRILMVFAPAWMWLHCPSWSVCAISSVDDNVKRDSHGQRDLVSDAWYRETFDIKWTLRRGIDAVGEWKTTAGGERKSRTMLGKYTGVHVDCILLDDPDDAHSVHSEAKRREVQDKWTRAIKNRVKHGDRSIRIAIQQRVHADDWTSSQVNKGIWAPDDRKAWAWVVMPLMFGKAPEQAPPMSPWLWTDPRRAANDNMQPGRFSLAFIADEIRDKGSEGFEAQYNQNPQSYDNGLIRRSHVQFFRIKDEPISIRPRPMGCGLTPEGLVAPTLVLGKTSDGGLDLDWMTVSIDASNGSEAVTASAVGILVVGGKGQQRFVFDDRTAVMGIDAMYEAIAACVGFWPVGRVLVELKAAGSSVIADLNKRIRESTLCDDAGAPKVVVVESVTPLPGDSKEGRAAAMRSAWEQGLVYVLEGAPWLYAKVIGGGRVVDEGFVSEMTSFPRSKRNDRVDAMSQLMTYYRSKGDVHARWKALSKLGQVMRQ